MGKNWEDSAVSSINDDLDHGWWMTAYDYCNLEVSYWWLIYFGPTSVRVKPW